MFKLSLRRLIKDRSSTLLNLTGLSTGLACALLIWLWVHDEWQTDRFHEHGERLYQVMADKQTGTAGPLGQELARVVPGVERAATMAPAMWFEPFSISYQDNTLSAQGNFVTNDFFSLFSFRLLQGNLVDKNSVVLSKSLAIRLFHTTEHVLGKTITWKLFDFSGPVTISGIYDDMPANSTIHMDFVLSLDAWAERMPVMKDLGNGTGPFQTYVLLKPGQDVAHVEEQLGRLPLKPHFSLRKFTDIYLYDNGRITYVRLFSLIAIFILLIACINFMNLSTANAAGRMKEVGVRKAIGASRGSLIWQFLAGSLLLSSIALVLAVGLVHLLLPTFNAITGKSLSLAVDIQSILFAALITLFTGLLAGCYPAFYLTGFHPVITLKGKFLHTSGNAWARKGLVVFQFTVSVVFIFAVIVIYQQLQFVQKQKLGFEKDNVIYFQADGPAMQHKAELLAGIKNIPGVVNASGMMRNIIMPAEQGGAKVTWDGKNQDFNIRFAEMLADYDLVETLGMQLQQGRSFSRQYSSDKQGVLLNETAVKTMDITAPVGKTISVNNQQVKIIGVVKDFHFNSLHDVIKPFIFELDQQYTIVTMVRINDVKAIDRIAAYYKQFNPGYVFNYKFLDRDVQAQYQAEQVIAGLAKYFAGLAILISCLGLFGLAAFTAERRRKEISIRKVMGASVDHVVMLLSGDLLKLIIIAMVIAFPVAAVVMERWLEGFAYRVDVQPVVFVICAALVLVITICTVSFHSLKAALMNPVKSLHGE
jgi:ABC-type antimicrobial peptide transport system permease subunit